MQKGIIWHISFFIIASFFCFFTKKASAQISQNSDKFLGNITTNTQVDAGGGVPDYYTLWNQITCETETQWAYVENVQDYYNWSEADRAYNYAKQHNFPFKFYSLLGGAQLPEWFKTLSVTSRYEAIVKWMDEVKKHYPDLEMIDVVNDAIGMHQQGNPLMKESLGGGGKTGYDWLIKAFELAHERWPNAILIYNDYNTFRYETDNYIDLVRTLRDAGAPIDAYGCQSHDVDNISSENLQNAMSKIQDAVKIPMYITGLDINEEIGTTQKTQYQNVFPLMWEADYCAGVTIWGYVYGATWVDYSGLYKNGVERPAMTWLKEYMATDAAKNAKSPFPGGKKQISLYIKPASFKATRGDTLDITVRAAMVDKTKSIDSVKLYVKGVLDTIMTKAPYVARYVPTVNGKHDLKAVVYASDGNNYSREGSFTTVDPRTPYKEMAIPGIVEAEDFDRGGDGVTYHDSNNEKEGDGGSYRNDCEGVDVVLGNGGYAIGYTNDGEWLDYSVNVIRTGYYLCETTVSSGTTGSGFKLSLRNNDGMVELTDNISVPKTADSDWTHYTTLATKTLIQLEKGEQIIHLSITGGSCNIDKINFSLAGFTIDDITYNIESDTTVSVFCCNKKGIITIPSAINDGGQDYAVVEIKDNAFTNAPIITSISIPESVVTISSNAFEGCSNIDTIYWNTNLSPACLTQFCKNNLKHVLLGHNVSTIGSYAFADCATIESISIPESITNIGDYAFLNCTWLTSISLPENITTIGNKAFAGCKKLVYISILNNVSDIDNEAFYDCTAIEKLLWNNHLSPISVTQYCSNNLKTIELGEDFQSLDENVLQDCNLNTLVIGAGVKTINEQHFKAKPIKTIWLTNTPPDGYSNVEGVINYVANNNYDLLQKKIVYPFLSSMFNVNGVRYVPVSPSERTCDAIDCLYDKCYTNVVIDSTVSYKNVSMTVHKVNSYSFYRNDNITNAVLKINEGLGASVFEGCTNLLGILLDGAVNYIDSAAFKGCSSLKNIKIPDSTEMIGVSAFQNCTELSQIDLGIKLKSIGSYAFANCSSLNSIVIPQSVANISDYVFVGCTGIKTIVIDEAEDSIADVELILGSNGTSALFADCPLDSVFIGKNIVYPTNRDKGYSPFYSNSTLRTVVITNRETEISQNEFYGCSNLKKVSIGNGVTTIGSWAFSGCFSLDSFAFGTNVKSIGDEAFSDCNKMTKIISYASIPPICGSQALDDINKWNCTLYIPEGTLADYQSADQWREFFFILDDLENGVSGIYKDKSDNIESIFDLNGHKLDIPQSGTNIIRYYNGSIKKVVIE